MDTLLGTKGREGREGPTLSASKYHCGQIVWDTLPLCEEVLSATTTDFHFNPGVAKPGGCILGVVLQIELVKESTAFSLWKNRLSVASGGMDRWKKEQRDKQVGR